MAESYRWGKEEIKKYLEGKYTENARVLDVGAGCGTYYDLLGDYFEEIDGVEVFKGNIERYSLESKYKHIYNKDIRNFKYPYYDIVIFGDILEHLEVEEARKVLEYAIEHSVETIVAVPYLYEQGEVEGNVYEIHKQADLTKDIMQDRYPELKLLLGNDEYGYYVSCRN